MARSVFGIVERQDARVDLQNRPRGMARLTQAMCKCFDWSHLTEHPPGTEHVRAFSTVATMLLPTLAFAEWPSQEEFPEVRHVWPGVEARGA